MVAAEPVFVPKHRSQQDCEPAGGSEKDPSSTRLNVESSGAQAEGGGGGAGGGKGVGGRGGSGLGGGLGYDGCHGTLQTGSRVWRHVSGLAVMPHIVNMKSCGTHSQLHPSPTHLASSSVPVSSTTNSCRVAVDPLQLAAPMANERAVMPATGCSSWPSTEYMPWHSLPVQPTAAMASGRRKLAL